MSSNSPDPNSPRPDGWLDRLKSMASAMGGIPLPGDPRPPDRPVPDTWEGPALTSAPPDVPMGVPVDGVPVALPLDPEVPLAHPVEEVPLAEAAPPELERVGDPSHADITLESDGDPCELEQPTSDEIPLLTTPAEAVGQQAPCTVSNDPEPPAAILCPVCQSPRRGDLESCDDCGYYYSSADLAGGAAQAQAAPMISIRLQDRFEMSQLLGERHGVERYRGFDHGQGAQAPVQVIILRQALEPDASSLQVAEAIDPDEDDGDEIMPSFDEALTSGSPATAVLPARAGWPSIAWERGLLRTLEQPGLPQIISSFVQEGSEYLVEEVPAGRSFWDAWDDPETTHEHRFGWLVQIAETLASLHHCNAMLEGIRPDLVIVADNGHARITDMADLLPLPLPLGLSVRGTLYTAPELMAANGSADTRAGLYSFGAMLYALHVGRELQEIDFDRPGHPKPFIPRFPDIHPGFGRLVTKTFRREPASRFPTDEASKEDPSGFIELIRTLNVLRRTMDLVRVEVASWTTTGIVRTGNEDAFALLHACESRQDDLGEQVLILLADGMGGYEAGEVAAALAIQVMRQNLVQQKPFGALAGKSPFPTDPLAAVSRPEGHAAEPLDVEVCKLMLKLALKDANKQVFQASRAPGSKRRGMGCTAEAVYLDGRNVVVAHVGDSRTYHLHEGRMIQLTRDQTLVNRLVELGTLTAEEAETHPRRNELQQAIGGQPDVEPGVYHGKLKPGDWVLVCSDGLTNHVSALSLKEMLQSEAQSAEMAARRLVNLTNIEGATDNATVVVVRCT